MGTKLIYAYVLEDKVKYIGQTNNLKVRRKQHEKYDPYNPNTLEYNYPLSRAIRKYGADAFTVVILEDDIPEELIDEREVYWIAFYNTYKDASCYNQNMGGNGNNKTFKFTDEEISFAKEKIKEGMPFNDIAKLTGMSVVYLSELNKGRRRASKDEEYPLYHFTQGRKLTEEQVDKIIDMLMNTDYTQQQIADRCNTKQGSVTQINRGKTHRRENISYPIREPIRK